MKTSGIVFEGQRFWSPYGAVAPPAAIWPDVSRYGNDGTITTATWVQLPSGLWVLDFNSATPDYVTIPAAFTQLDFTSQDFSLVARVNVDAFSALYSGIFERGATGTDGYVFRIRNNGEIRLWTSQTPVNQRSDSNVGVVTVGSWVTIGFSRNGASVRLYADGIDVTATPAVHIDPLTSARSAKIGIQDNLTGFPFDGKIALLQIYDYALSADEHNKAYASANYLLN